MYLLMLLLTKQSWVTNFKVAEHHKGSSTALQAKLLFLPYLHLNSELSWNSLKSSGIDSCQ